MGPLWRQPRWLDILGLRLPAGQTGIGRAWPGKWRPFPRSGPGMSGRAIGQTLYYGAGHAESNCLLLTLVSRPGKTVSLESWGRSGAGLSLPTCWAEMTESSGEGMCHAGVQRRWVWARILTGVGPRVLWGALELSHLLHQSCWEGPGLSWHFLEEAI